MDPHRRSPHFQDVEDQWFQVCHPLSACEPELNVFDDRTTYRKAIHAAIAMMEEYGLPWVALIGERETRTVYHGSLWLTGSCLFISRRHSIFHAGCSEQTLLAEEPMLRPTGFGWGFYHADDACDGMDSKYISWRLRPLLGRHFARRASFVFHAFAFAGRPPDIPAWLPAEAFATGAIVVYADTGCRDIPAFIQHTQHMQDRIAAVLGGAIAERWAEDHKVHYPPVTPPADDASG